MARSTSNPESRLPLLRRRWLGAALLLALTIALAYGSRASWLPVGELLIKSDPLEAADIVVVLAGDLYGERILLGAELVDCRRDSFTMADAA